MRYFLAFSLLVSSMAFSQNNGLELFQAERVKLISESLEALRDTLDISTSEQFLEPFKHAADGLVKDNADENFRGKLLLTMARFNGSVTLSESQLKLLSQPVKRSDDVKDARNSVRNALSILDFVGRCDKPLSDADVAQVTLAIEQMNAHAMRKLPARRSHVLLDGVILLVDLAIRPPVTNEDVVSSIDSEIAKKLAEYKQVLAKKKAFEEDDVNQLKDYGRKSITLLSGKGNETVQVLSIVAGTNALSSLRRIDDMLETDMEKLSLQDVRKLEASIKSLNSIIRDLH